MGVDVRVLYLIDSLAFGGAERSLAALAPQYRDLGIDLVVGYFKERPGVHDALRAAGANVLALDPTGTAGRRGWIAAARHAIAESKPDLVHTTLFEADVAGRVAARMERVPVVTTLANVAYGPEQQVGRGPSSLRVRGALVADALTARAVVRFHAITHHVADVMTKRLRLDPSKVDVVPRGRDPEELGNRTADRASRVRASLRVGDSPLVVAAARHEPQKGLDVLLEAFPAVRAGVPDVRLVIAGREGNTTARLRALVDVHGLRDSVDLVGARDDVPDLLAAADAFVMPSRWEGLGSVLLEAMALEAPIVASDLPAVREVVDDRTAALVPAGDPGALAAAIIATLTGHDASVRALGARTRFLRNFTIRTVAAQMRAFYARALAS